MACFPLKALTPTVAVPGPTAFRPPSASTATTASSLLFHSRVEALPLGSFAFRAPVSSRPSTSLLADSATLDGAFPTFTETVALAPL